MAERSFKKEVQKLRLGEGEVFHGEGILAVTKALLQSGVSYVAGYQGAPISHLMDVLADANDILAELGVHFEHSASEATATATLAASVNYPLRGAATFKSTVGTNVASDALANLASGGVTGGALIIVGEDYGEGSSIMQERSHAFAMKSQVWLLDPRPNLPSIVQAVESGFELSEATNTPVMLELRIRACHVHGRFVAKANRRPAFTLKDAIEQPRRQTDRIVLPPASYLHEREKIEKRWPAAVKFIQDHRLNEFFAEDAQDFGIVLQGGMYNNVVRALELLGLSDAYGEHPRPAVRAQRHLPARGRRGGALLRRQARGTDRRGRPARIHRAAAQHRSAPRRCPDPVARQGHAADGRRVHRRGRAAGRGQVHRASRRGAAGSQPAAGGPARRSPSLRRCRRRRNRCTGARPPSAPAAPSGRYSPR